MQIDFGDALEDLKTEQEKPELTDSTDALDDYFGSETGNETDALENLGTSEAASKGEEKSVEQTEPEKKEETAEETKEGNETTETSESGAAEEGEAKEGEETTAETTEEKVEEATDDVMKAIEEITKELDENSDEQKEIVQNSGLSEEEKTKFMDSIREKDEIIFELQSRLQSSEDKLKGAISENQNFKMDSAVNQRFLEKFENDSDVQQFVNLKIKAEAGDEKAQGKMEEFLKSQLSNLGYDIEALVRQKKLAEKKALSNNSTSKSDYNYDESIDDGDALDTLDI